MLPICSACLFSPLLWFCFRMIFRIKDDWEARRIQVCRSGGAIQFQLWWQCPWDELSPLFPFPFLTVTECSEMKTLVLLPEVVVPELVLLSHSSIWLLNLNSTRRCGKATKRNQCLGKQTKDLNAKQVGEKKNKIIKLWTMLSYGIQK